MDPLSIATSVGSLSGACLLTLRNLGEAIGKFKDAPKTLKDISSEAKIISISLSQLRNALISDEYSISTQGLLEPDIRNTLDIALTGCKMTLPCIETEMSSLAKGMATDQGLTFSDRARVFWKDDKFKELLQQLSRQHNAIATLQQGFQMKALADMVKLMVTNRATIQKVAEGTRSLRGLYPQFNAAKSFLETIESDDSRDREFSVISERQFEFDDVVTNAQAYRRVLVAATHTLRTNNNEQTSGTGGTTKEGGPTGTEISAPQGANQSRKMNATIPSWSGGLKSQDTGSASSNALPEDGNSQSSTFRDSNSFAQQIRGYLDNVEGELRNSAEEAARLRALLQKKDSQMENFQTELEKYVKMLKDAESLRVSLEGKYSNSQMEIGALCFEKEYLQEHQYKLEDKLLIKTQALEESEREKGDLRKNLRKSEQRNQDAAHACNDLVTKMKIKESEIQELEVYFALKLEQAAQMELDERHFIQLVHSSRTAQLGTILLVPMQSAAWLDESNKGPPQFQLISAPKNSDGSFAKWNGEENKWIFANEPGKTKELTAAPIVSTAPPNPPSEAMIGESKDEKVNERVLTDTPSRSPSPTLTKKPLNPKTVRQWNKLTGRPRLSEAEKDARYK